MGWSIADHMRIELVTDALNAAAAATRGGGRAPAGAVFHSDHGSFTIPLGINLFRGEHDDQYHLMMAVSTIVLIPIIVVFLAAQRYFIRGVTLSGIAGR